MEGVHLERSRDGDAAALRALYHATDGVNWRTPWDLTANPKTWHGVNMNGVCRVVSLSLRKNKLQGEGLTARSD